MNSNSDDPTVVLLQRATAGDVWAQDELLKRLDGELRIIARRSVHDQAQVHSLHPSAILGELWQRLFAGGPVEIRDRGHFLALAAKKFREIIGDRAKARVAVKRDVRRNVALDLDEAAVATRGFDDEDVLAIEECLQRLEKQNQMQGRIVELLFYGGLTQQEVAEQLGVQREWVGLQWGLARTRLYNCMQGA